MIPLRNGLWGFILSFPEAWGRGSGLHADSGLKIEAKSSASQLLAVILRKLMIFLSLILSW